MTDEKEFVWPENPTLNDCARYLVWLNRREANAELATASYWERVQEVQRLADLANTKEGCSGETCPLHGPLGIHRDPLLARNDFHFFFEEFTGIPPLEDWQRGIINRARLGSVSIDLGASAFPVDPPRQVPRWRRVLHWLRDDWNNR